MTSFEPSDRLKADIEEYRDSLERLTDRDDIAGEMATAILEAADG